MRSYFLVGALVAACAVTGETQAGTGPVSLACPPNPAASVAHLCTALEGALRDSGYRLQKDAGAKIRLVLEAEAPQPNLLTARLTVEQDGARRAGEQGTLSVMDRDQIPPARIDDFARKLLARAALSGPPSHIPNKD